MALQTTSKMDSHRTTGADEPHNERSIDTQTVSYGPSTDQIAEDDLWQALSNSRRRHVIRALEDGPREMGALARTIAAIENDIAVEDVDAQQRKRVWIGLRQAHLPKLDDWGIVEWGLLDETVDPGPAHAEVLAAIKAVAGDDEPDSIVDRVVGYLRGGA